MHVQLEFSPAPEALERAIQEAQNVFSEVTPPFFACALLPGSICTLS